MRRRLRIRDILGLPLVILAQAWQQARTDAQISARRRQADHLRPGSLTYNRQQAQRLHERGGRSNGPCAGGRG